MLDHEFETALFEALKAMGLSESQAAKAAGGRDHSFLKPADLERPLTESEAVMVEAFQAMGLSESAARVATVGRFPVELLEVLDGSKLTEVGRMVAQSNKLAAEAQKQNAQVEAHMVELRERRI